MYKIMLVEDEPPILYAVKHLIDTGNYGFQVSAVARNGRDALHMLKDNVPDVILTDIRMPFVDGLTLLEEVRQKYIGVACVIMSGYNDFEYAVKALRVHAFDYLLKPIQIEKLQSMLQGLKQSLDTRKSVEEQAAISQAVYFEDYSGTGDIDFGSLKFIPMIVCSGHYVSNSVQDSDHPGREFWEQVDIRKQLGHELGDARLWVLNGFSLNEKIVVFGGDDLDENRIEKVSLELKQRLMNDVLPVQMIVGKMIFDVRELSKAIKKLRTHLSKMIVFGHSGLYIEEKTKSIPFMMTEEFEKRYDALFNGMTMNEVKKNLQGLLKEWETKRYTQDAVEHLLKQLVLKLINWLKNYKGISDLPTDISEIVSGSTGYQDLYVRYGRIIDMVYEHSEGTTYLNLSIAEIVDRMEQFLKSSFTQPISYKMFYDLFGYNETYLSQVFKLSKGITPNKYVTRLRIDKAKECMAACPGIALKKVASMVGYDDVFYFSRVFKDVTGQSPTEFMKQEAGNRQ
ncbi:response regulator [Paenibacillus sp. LMG 31458]|uniref:Response regulator n=1 Tax=Paenibacillus phytorum TaxID=2654977 RepID=A0ABX1Y7X5_9BACL|nr:response regulator [Paenibacillus phytorum]NOU77027.1 response regulator [Paenibacillus phytorum]